MWQLQRVSPRIEGVEETMKIRRLEKEEHQVVRSLYEEVFSEDSTSFVDYYFTETVSYTHLTLPTTPYV